MLFLVINFNDGFLAFDAIHHDIDGGDVGVVNFLGRIEPYFLGRRP
jgi:hypothetical protein